MTDLAELALDLFLLGHEYRSRGLAGDGFGFERLVRSHLDGRGMPNSSGFRVFGQHSLSGLYHQIDEQTRCEQVHVVGEWKAYRGRIPKNDLLRFKAVTDDYWMSPEAQHRVPVVRIFGGTGTVTDAMRVYAAQWGIVLVTPDRWPIPVLCHDRLVWSVGDSDTPSVTSRRALASLVQPMNRILVPGPRGGWTIPALTSAGNLKSRLALWSSLSEAAWESWNDRRPASFEWLLAHRGIGMPAA